uniref:U-myrmeciitoxin(01)-Mg3a n=1 Tax=Myrmecia gulosa TaxID=36170 RepID=TX13A_MYRGU|nr:RecName: Full=U-myrmeciitoxin(01)-Mg3a; Short=MIITX(01)-Mg3a; Short=U-MIITX(01)-Mg3a; Flags: Precursor [Myrmecia gulosa]
MKTTVILLLAIAIIFAIMTTLTSAKNEETMEEALKGLNELKERLKKQGIDTAALNLDEKLLT